MPFPKGPGTENCFLTLVTWGFVAFLPAGLPGPALFWGELGWSSQRITYPKTFTINNP